MLQEGSFLILKASALLLALIFKAAPWSSHMNTNRREEAEEGATAASPSKRLGAPAAHSKMSMAVSPFLPSTAKVWNGLGLIFLVEEKLVVENRSRDHAAVQGSSC